MLADQPCSWTQGFVSFGCVVLKFIGPEHDMCWLLFKVCAVLMFEADMFGWPFRGRSLSGMFKRKRTARVYGASSLLCLRTHTFGVPDVFVFFQNPTRGQPLRGLSLEFFSQVRHDSFSIQSPLPYHNPHLFDLSERCGWVGSTHVKLRFMRTTLMTAGTALPGDGKNPKVRLYCRRPTRNLGTPVSG